MRSLARVLLEIGWSLSGSDPRAESVADLRDRGVRLFANHAADNVAETVGLVIFSDAIGPGNPELQRAGQRKIPTLRYFQALGLLADARQTIAVAGTHGKSTVSAMIGAILRTAGADTTAPRITPGAFSQPMPMLAWGGQSKAAARRAGRNGLGFLAQGPGPGLQEIYEETARANGHEPGFCYLPAGDAPQIVFVNDDIDQGWDEVGTNMLADAVSYAAWNEAADLTANTVSLSSAKTVDDLRAEGGAHRVVTAAEAGALAAEYGMLSLHPLCGGLAPDVAWPYLKRAAAAVEAPA